jgi:hypothetical protein
MSASVYASAAVPHGAITHKQSTICNHPAVHRLAGVLDVAAHLMQVAHH